MDEMKQPGPGQAETLKTKHGLLKKILEVSARQPALIEGEDMEGLNRCMAERDSLAAEIDKLNATIVTLQPSPGSIQAEDEIYQLLLAIQAQDAENIQLAESKLKEYSGKIAQIKQTRKGIQSYTMNIGVQDGSFIDKKK